MRAFITVSAFVVLVLLQHSPAYSQSTGTHIGPRAASPTGTSENETRRLLANFARCTVSNGSSRIERVLLGSPNSPNYSQDLAELMNPNCLSSGGIRMPPLVIRGVLFEALFQSRYGEFRPQNMSEFPDLDFQSLNSGEMTTIGAQVISMNYLSECVIRAASIQSRSLLDTTPGSEDENNVLQEITPHLGPCLTEGNTMQLSKTVLRGGLVEVFYRFAIASRAAQGSR